MLRRVGTEPLYEAEPINRQEFFIREIAHHDIENPQGIQALGRAMLGLGGQNEDKRQNIYEIGLQVQGFLARIVNNLNQAQNGSFQVPTQINFIAIALDKIQNLNITNAQNQLVTIVSALRIVPKLGFSIYDIATRQIYAITDISQLPTAYGECMGIRLDDNYDFESASLYRGLGDGISHLFNGVVIYDSVNDITQEEKQRLYDEEQAKSRAERFINITNRAPSVTAQLHERRRKTRKLF